MNCRFCAAKLGLMERWRYGDFCSQEHKTEFNSETQRLVKERLLDLRRPAKSISTNTLFVDSPTVPGVGDEQEPLVAVDAAAPPDPAEAPAPAPVLALAADPPVAAEPALDPEIQEFVTHSIIAPIRPTPSVPPPEPPPAKPGRKDWKYLAKVADFDLLPVGINTGFSRLFRTMDVANTWEDATFAIPGSRSVFIPEPFQPEMKAARAKMPSAELTPREAYQNQSWANAPEPVTVPHTTWVDDTGRRWVISARQPGPADYPAIGEVLEEYPLAAPWTSWPDWMLNEGTGTWAPANSPRQTQRPDPSAFASQPPGPAGQPAAPDAPPSAAPQSFNLAPLAPAAPAPLNMAGSASSGRGGRSGRKSAPAPASTQSGGALAAAPGHSSAQGRAAGSPGSVGAGSGGSSSGGSGSGGSGPDESVATGHSSGGGGGGRSGGSSGRKASGGRWQPIVPPIFHALIDVAHDMVPSPLEPAIYGLPLWPFRPAMARPSQPDADLATRARLSPDFRGPRRLAAGDPALGGGPVLWLECASEPWPQPRLGLPRLFAQATKPGLPPLPRHVALRLPLLDRWNPQVSEPAMFLGANARW